MGVGAYALTMASKPPKISSPAQDHPRPTPHGSLKLASTIAEIRGYQRSARRLQSRRSRVDRGNGAHGPGVPVGAFWQHRGAARSRRAGRSKAGWCLGFATPGRAPFRQAVAQSTSAFSRCRPFAARRGDRLRSAAAASGRRGGSVPATWASAQQPKESVASAGPNDNDGQLAFAKQHRTATHQQTRHLRTS